MSRTDSSSIGLLSNQVTTYFNFVLNETDFEQILVNFRTWVRMFLILFVLWKQFDMVQVRVNSHI